MRAAHLPRSLHAAVALARGERRDGRGRSPYIAAILTATAAELISQHADVLWADAAAPPDHRRAHVCPKLRVLGIRCGIEVGTDRKKPSALFLLVQLPIARDGLKVIGIHAARLGAERQQL